ncbi:hypothetical protein L1987_34617 [Smallanthus sonchifolius]|uniref:Uncharacterized protein n=1 Tax=Smallanthus sonchifolius TaxID=185202 RepID=A0ACB9HUD0_9ASTR|nr:hypothetical protein L1987_34617 [Smallanthus sonchifolius]
MMDLISCSSQYAVQVSESASCSSYTPASSCIVSPNLIPSTQTAVTCFYKTTLSTGDHHFITVTWHRNATTQGLQITSGDDSTPPFRLNTHSGLFRKKKGNKSFEINGSKFEVYYDLSSAQYGAGAEPVEGYYVLIMVDSELGLLIGDMTEESTVKKLKPHKQIGKFALISRKEHFSGNTLYSTKARFADTGSWHDILIRCAGENEGLKYPVLQVCIDKRVVIRVKRLQWNFRGNQTIFLDGLLVDLMWDVHDWFFNPDPGSGSGSGHAVFMFRTRSGLDSRLWLEEKMVKSDDDQKKGFSFLVYATKS